MHQAKVQSNERNCLNLKKRANILVLTATVTPKLGSLDLKRADPKLRLRDYENALPFYLHMLDDCVDGIVFAENSNSNIDTLKTMASKNGFRDRVEFLSFDGLDYPQGYDRACGEFKLIDYVMSHSALINRLLNDDAYPVCWKVTGRYVIRNLAAIIGSASREFDLYCNCKNYRSQLQQMRLSSRISNVFKRFKQTDMFLFAWTVSGYEHCIKGIWPILNIGPEEVQKGIFQPEQRWREIIDKAPQDVRVVKRLRITPEIQGVRGYDDKAYHVENRWKFVIRNLVQRLFPWFWI